MNNHEPNRYLATGDPHPRSCLHGLNAVFLRRHGWYRIDARGNRADITAAFCPPVEQLAFRAALPAECDFPEILPEPLPLVVTALTHHTTVEQLAEHLPDLEPWEPLPWPPT